MNRDFSKDYKFWFVVSRLVYAIQNNRVDILSPILSDIDNSYYRALANEYDILHDEELTDEIEI